MATRQRSGVKRRVDSRNANGIDGYVATFYPDGVRLRPVRARKAEAEIYVSWDQVYQRALVLRVPALDRQSKTARRARAT